VLGEDGLRILRLIAAGDEPHVFRKRVISVLGQMRDAAAVPDLSRIIASPDEDVVLKIVAARTLGEIGGPTSTEALRRHLRARDALVRQKVVHALGSIGDVRSMGRLRQVATKDASKLVREAASNALKRIAAMNNVDPERG
jgi:HEAT repeat protein